MRLTRSWRIFRRMQDTILIVAGLVYSFAVIQAWRLLPGGRHLKFERTALLPGIFLALSLVAALMVPILRQALTRHLWISYRTGFGQSVISVLGGVGVLLALAGFVFWQINDAAHGGRYPGGAFSGYAAGIGLLVAQSILVRRIEGDPVLRRQIEEL
ncbi:MAG TPA: hypothetical protein VK801_16095 [Caulobacteraceae bacterium]|jgi:hypothetical protein|nr:hypothetical protein [Caulobacteraceae bacterium]